MKIRRQRNWSDYNKKLKNIARVDFFISEDAINNWYYSGKRLPGGKILYSTHVIELCLLIREYYRFGYRQTQGFISSIFTIMGLNIQAPDYTTLSRRAQDLSISLNCRKLKSNCGIVVAIDSTGLSIYSRSEWAKDKNNGRQEHRHNKWRKLHIIIDVYSGDILESKYTKAAVNDNQILPEMLDKLDQPIESVCGDMAYDSLDCRKAIKQKNARQLIPPIRAAKLSENNRGLRKYREILQERDDAINYIKYNTINGNNSLARKSWKEKVGYHARSLIEATMLQIKSHCSDILTNRREDTRATQARIKCKLVNKIIAA